VFWTVDTEGGLFDCSKINWNNCFVTWSYEEKGRNQYFFANMLIIKLFQLYNYDVRVCAGNSRNYWQVNNSRSIIYDVRARLGNSRNYWPANSSLSWTVLEFQKTVKNTKLHLYKVSGNKTVYNWPVNSPRPFCLNFKNSKTYQITLYY